jgi:hypothetical protein
LFDNGLRTTNQPTGMAWLPPAARQLSVLVVGLFCTLYLLSARLRCLSYAVSLNFFRSHAGSWSSMPLTAVFARLSDAWRHFMDSYIYLIFFFLPSWDAYAPQCSASPLFSLGAGFTLAPLQHQPFCNASIPLGVLPVDDFIPAQDSLADQLCLFSHHLDPTAVPVGSAVTALVRIHRFGLRLPETAASLFIYLLLLQWSTPLSLVFVGLIDVREAESFAACGHVFYMVELLSLLWSVGVLLGSGEPHMYFEAMFTRGLFFAAVLTSWVLHGWKEVGEELLAYYILMMCITIHAFLLSSSQDIGSALSASSTRWMRARLPTRLHWLPNAFEAVTRFAVSSSSSASSAARAPNTRRVQAHPHTPMHVQMPGQEEGMRARVWHIHEPQLRHILGALASFDETTVLRNTLHSLTAESPADNPPPLAQLMSATPRTSTHLSRLRVLAASITDACDAHLQRILRRPLHSEPGPTGSVPDAGSETALRDWDGTAAAEAATRDTLDECVVCRVNEACMRLSPCDHVPTCLTCHTELARRAAAAHEIAQCPLCNVCVFSARPKHGVSGAQFAADGALHAQAGVAALAVHVARHPDLLHRLSPRARQGFAAMGIAAAVDS